MNGWMKWMNNGFDENSFSKTAQNVSYIILKKIAIKYLKKKKSVKKNCLIQWSRTFYGISVHS